MSGVLGGDILGKSDHLDVEHVTLSERLRSLDLEIDPASVIAEAAAVLREVRDFLLTSDDRYGLGAPPILNDLLFLYTVHLSKKGERIQVAGLSIIDLLEADEPDGTLRAADILDDIQETLRIDTARTAWSSRARIEIARFELRLAATVCRSKLCLEPQISCDADECLHISNGSSSLKMVTLWARWAGWLISDERDLCPSHCESLGIVPPTPLSEEFVEGQPYSFWQEAHYAFKSGMPLEKFVVLLQAALDEAAQISLLSGTLGSPWVVVEARGPVTTQRGYALAALEALNASLTTPLVLMTKAPDPA